MPALIQLLDDAEDATPLDLAEFPGDTISDFRFGAEQEVQTDRGVRAASARSTNRGNFTESLTLEVTFAPKATPAEARQAAVALKIAIRAKLTTAMLLRWSFNDVVFELADAAMQRASFHPRGVAVVVSMEFVGSEITEHVEEPEEPEEP